MCSLIRELFAHTKFYVVLHQAIQAVDITESGRIQILVGQRGVIGQIAMGTINADSGFATGIVVNKGVDPLPNNLPSLVSFKQTAAGAFTDQNVT